MTRKLTLAVLLALSIPTLAAADPADTLRLDAGAAQLVAPPAAELVRTRTLEWVARRGITDKALLDQVGKLWALAGDPPTAEELFENTIRTFCLADADTRAFVEACGLKSPPLVAPQAKLLEERASDGPFYAANMTLFYGRYLAHRQMFDESLAVLEQAPIVDVVDPATLLFFKAVCQHHLLMKSEGLATIEQLLKNTEGVPVRYATVASLMQYDLEALTENSLDEVSRKMSDVERRLNLGRTGEKVQKREEEIIVTLDDIIKKIEDQQGGGGGSGGNQNRSNAPASDSVVKGATAPGKVDPKKLGNTAEWGDLPPRMRAKAKDEISRKFPPHYDRVIDEFTKNQANRAAASGK